jgi:nanoRNase/pAp phosphatase (c-di-AMP/oligoRNAs hydrolase)
MESINRITRFLSRNRKRLSPLLILTHDYPDPDAIASAVAFQYLTEQGYGIRSRIVYGGVIGRMENREMVRILKLPVHKLHHSDLKKYAQVALVDTQPAFGNNSFPQNRKAAIVIDQHPSEKEPISDLSIVDTESGATSVLVAQLLLAHRIDIPVKVATALVYGILTDTLNLFRVNKAEIVETYLELLPRCDVRALARIQNPLRSRRFFTTLARGIQKAVVNRGLIVTHLGFVENPDLVSQIADFLLTYRGMSWSFCSGRYGTSLHVSLRAASPNGRAGEILRDIFFDRGQAGGHGRIAGGRVAIGEGAGESQWKKTEQSLTRRLSKRLRLPARSHPYSPFIEQKLIGEGKRQT